MMVFKIPDYYKDIYDLFLDGKYSKFSNKYKDVLLKMYGRSVHPTFMTDSRGNKIGFSELGHKVSVFEAINPTYEKRVAIGKVQRRIQRKNNS